MLLLYHFNKLHLSYFIKNVVILFQELPCHMTQCTRLNATQDKETSSCYNLLPPQFYEYFVRKLKQYFK